MSDILNSVLITGANGFLGKAIIKELSDNYKLFSLSRSHGDYNVFLENEIPSFKQKFGIIIHAAGKAHSVPKTELEKKQFHDVNVNGTKNLLQGLEKVGVPKQFVFISSVSVYGLECGIDIKEECPLEAKDPYGLSKIGAEEVVTEWCKKHNVVYTILRLPLLVGENPPGNLGAMIKAIDNRYYFNIGGGTARKSMVLAKDVAIFIPLVARIGGTYNLSDGFHPNFNELSRVISKQRNRKSPVNLPLFIAKLLGCVGDLLGNKVPLNSAKLKKVTSDLTFDDTNARLIAGWSSESVIDWYGK